MDTIASAARSYGAARPLTAPHPESPVADAATRLGASFAQTLAQADTTARQAMTGDADPHALVTALSEAQLAVETAVAVRDRVVEAYLEVLRMPL